MSFYRIFQGVKKVSLFMVFVVVKIFSSFLSTQFPSEEKRARPQEERSSAFGLASLGTIEEIETKYRLNVTKIEIKIKMNSVIWCTFSKKIVNKKIVWFFYRMVPKNYFTSFLNQVKYLKLKGLVRAFFLLFSAKRLEKKLGHFLGQKDWKKSWVNF